MSFRAGSLRWLAADGKLYLINFDGLATVIDAATGDVIRRRSRNLTASGTAEVEMPT